MQWAYWPATADLTRACADQLAYAPSDTLIMRPLGRLNRGQALTIILTLTLTLALALTLILTLSLSLTLTLIPTLP